MKAFIAVDFDGTCVLNKYPKIGPDVPNCVDVLKELAKHQNVILYTVRSGKYLNAAVNWFKEKDIKLYGVNDNPSQHAWSNSRKIHADLFIDDRNLGCPLITNIDTHPFVNWVLVEKFLIKAGMIPKKDD